MKGPGGVAGAGWRCVEAAAGLLAPLEREVVLGDLAETERGAWRGLGDVLGLAARRQLALWRSWRPWAASFGLALPASLFLMGWSVAASGAVASLLGEPAQTRLLWVSFSRLFLVILWAWMAGFVVGAVSRGTLWASMLGCCVPCLYCLSKWPGHGFSFLRLLIFVLPGLWGVWRGRRDLRLGLGWAFFLAGMATLAPLMCSKGGWYGCWLLWPGWYLAATARRKQDYTAKTEPGGRP
jgi:hypothetical protein